MFFSSLSVQLMKPNCTLPGFDASWLASFQVLIIEELVLLFGINYSVWASVGKNGPGMECDIETGLNPEHPSQKTGYTEFFSAGRNMQKTVDVGVPEGKGNQEVGQGGCRAVKRLLTTPSNQA